MFAYNQFMTLEKVWYTDKFIKRRYFAINLCLRSPSLGKCLQCILDNIK
jgi:hypothetical protein